MATPTPGLIYQRLPAKTSTSSTSVIMSTNSSTGEVILYDNVPGVASNAIGVNGNNIPSPVAYWDATNRKWQSYDATTTIGVDDDLIDTFLNQNSSDLTKNAAAVINKNYKDSVEDRNKFQNIPGIWKDNVATTGITSTTASADTSLNLTEEDQKRLAEGLNITAQGGSGKFGTLRYPEKLESETSDVIKFTMIEYKSKGFDKQFLTLSQERPQSETILGTTVLSIQPRISDTNQVNWQESNMDPIQVGMAQASFGFIEGGFDGTKGTIDQFKATVSSEQENIKTALKTYFAGQAASTQNLLGRLTGSILNPNLELLFDGPTTRTFNYNFTFSPREDTEAKMVARIIRFFKEGMAVQRSTTSLFLKSPYVFNIEYLLKEGTSNHPFINRIKGPCALTNCGVDYTPNGSYMTYSDGSMISYNVSLTFQELEPVYLDDYKEIPQDQIGY